MPAASHETAVRQTPFTDRLSPGAISTASVVVNRSLNPAGVGLTSATSPSASISPVNIPFYQDIGPEKLSSDGAQPSKRQRKPLLAAHPQSVWRHVHLDAIHEPGVPEGPVQRRATLDDHRRYPSGRQLLQRAIESSVCNQDLRAGA